MKKGNTEYDGSMTLVAVRAGGILAAFLSCILLFALTFFIGGCSGTSSTGAYTVKLLRVCPERVEFMYASSGEEGKGEIPVKVVYPETYEVTYTRHIKGQKESKEYRKFVDKKTFQALRKGAAFDGSGTVNRPCVVWGAPKEG